jgi:hypothetical protein
MFSLRPVMTTDDVPNAKVRIGVDTGLALAVNNGRNGNREPLFLGSPANHAAKLASNWKAEGIFLTNTARKVAGFEEVDEGTEGTSPLTPEEIKKCQDEAKLDVKRDDIVKEWRQDNEKNPIGSFVFSRPTPPLNQGGLRLTRTLRATSCRLLEIRPPFPIG